MNANEIKKVCKTLIALFCCVLLIDFAVGLVFDSFLILLPCEGERVAKSNYVLTQVRSDIVIIGSSRAECHYDSKMIQNSLQSKSVFNCGVDGSLFFYEVAAFNCILDRYTPDVMIWDLQMNELMEDDQLENLGLLYPYYKSNAYIRRYLDSRDPELKYMIWLNSFRYNATGSRIIRSLGLHDSNLLGFVGKETADASRIIEHKTIQQEESILDDDKIELFKQALTRANSQGTRLIVVQSPYYYHYIGQSSTSSMVRTLCNEHDIQFIDDTQLPGFVGNDNLVYDSGHLNIEGARQFTRILIGQLVLNEDRIFNSTQ